MSPAFFWRAIYRDGTWLDEYGEGSPGGNGWGFGHIDLSRCVDFALLPQRDGLTQHVVHVDPDAGQRLIFFRRWTIGLNVLTEEEVGARSCVHVIGYQFTKGGANSKALLYVFEDGSALLADNDQAV